MRVRSCQVCYFSIHLASPPWQSLLDAWRAELARQPLSMSEGEACRVLGITPQPNGVVPEEELKAAYRRCALGRFGSSGTPSTEVAWLCSSTEVARHAAAGGLCSGPSHDVTLRARPSPTRHRDPCLGSTGWRGCTIRTRTRRGGTSLWAFRCAKPPGAVAALPPAAQMASALQLRRFLRQVWAGQLQHSRLCPAPWPSNNAPALRVLSTRLRTSGCKRARRAARDPNPGACCCCCARSACCSGGRQTCCSPSSECSSRL